LEGGGKKTPGDGAGVTNGLGAESMKKLRKNFCN
jgi:hypothetical protein